ncbi:MAG: NAD-dependent epimerase/dehydratase family protein, partial [Spirochaetales bacterium]
NLDLEKTDAGGFFPAGTEIVIHAAALAYDWGSLDLFKRVNTEVTEKLLRFSQESGCRQFIYISSISVHGFGNHVETTEEGPYYPLINPYQVSKKAAEEAVLAADSPAFDTAVIRPGNVYGPGDTTTFFPIFEAMERGIMGYIGKGGSLTCPVYVTDLTEAVAACIGCPAAKAQIFNITGGEKTTWEMLLNLAAEKLGIKPPRIHLPVFLAKAAAGFLEGIFSLVKAKNAPALTHYRVDMLVHNYHFSIAKAANLLGYAPKIMWPEGIALTAEDYRKLHKPHAGV